jgi:hypothetical protein
MGEIQPLAAPAPLTMWRGLFTRAASAKDSASKQLAPHSEWRRPCDLIFGYDYGFCIAG